MKTDATANTHYRNTRILVPGRKSRSVLHGAEVLEHARLAFEVVINGGF
jgi:hypothetical protein